MTLVFIKADKLLTMVSQEKPENLLMTHQREFNVHEKMIIIIVSMVDCRF